MLPFLKLFQMHQPSPTPLFLFRFLGCIPRNLPQDPSQTAELIYIYIYKQRYVLVETLSYFEQTLPISESSSF